MMNTPYGIEELSEPYRPTLADIEHRNAVRSYVAASEPVIRLMMDLKSLYTSVRMFVGPNGALSDPVYHWTDANAENLYEQYEKYLRSLRCHIFGRNSDSTRKEME